MRNSLRCTLVAACCSALFTLARTAEDDRPTERARSAPGFERASPCTDAVELEDGVHARVQVRTSGPYLDEETGESVRFVWGTALFQDEDGRLVATILNHAVPRSDSAETIVLGGLSFDPYVFVEDREAPAASKGYVVTLRPKDGATWGATTSRDLTYEVQRFE